MNSSCEPADPWISARRERHDETRTRQKAGRTRRILNNCSRLPDALPAVGENGAEGLVRKGWVVGGEARRFRNRRAMQSKLTGADERELSSASIIK